MGACHVIIREQYSVTTLRRAYWGEGLSLSLKEISDAVSCSIN